MDGAGNRRLEVMAADRGVDHHPDLGAVDVGGLDRLLAGERRGLVEAHVAVVLSGANDRLLLEIADDGVGFDPAAAGIRSRRLGLTSMEERAVRIGGTLDVRSAKEIGTTVRLEAPVG